LHPRQSHFAADPVRWLFAQVEAGENLEIPVAHPTKDFLHELGFLSLDRLLFRRQIFRLLVSDVADIHLALAAPDIFLNSPAQLTVKHRPDEAHQAFRLFDLTATNRVDNREKDIVNPILDILSAEPALEEKPRSRFERFIEDLLARRIATLNQVYD